MASAKGSGGFIKDKVRMASAKGSGGGIAEKNDKDKIKIDPKTGKPKAAK